MRWKMGKMPAWYEAEMNTPCRKAQRAVVVAGKRLRQAKVDYDWAVISLRTWNPYFPQPGVRKTTEAEVEDLWKVKDRAAVRYHKRVEQQKAICGER